MNKHGQWQKHHFQQVIVATSDTLWSFIAISECLQTAQGQIWEGRGRNMARLLGATRGCRMPHGYFRFSLKGCRMRVTQFKIGDLHTNQCIQYAIHIIGILDGEESDIGFFGMRKNYIRWGEAESDIIFPNPIKPYIGRLNIRYCLYSQLFIPQQNNLF